ncbi:MAG: hypothetical protein QOG43_1234 [Actinomycetota bacterium]|jgi:hypothetical protein|nr:hypothetical protein [Actinomycetota bacterium]
MSRCAVDAEGTQVPPKLGRGPSYDHGRRGSGDHESIAALALHLLRKSVRSRWYRPPRETFGRPTRERVPVAVTGHP